jgi:hypothetical protein
MYPHGRLFLSALAFSASLGLLVAVAAFVLGLLEASGAFGPRADDAPLHGVVFLAFFVAPAFAVLSLVPSAPASYIVWKFQWIGFSHVAVSVAIASFAIVAAGLLPGSSLFSTAVAGVVLALAAVAAAYVWRSRSLAPTNRWSGRVEDKMFTSCRD